MRFEYYIARRIVSRSGSVQTFSRPVTAIAVGGIAIGIAMMLIAVAIVTGFKDEISQKVINFGSHIQVVNYDNNTSYETFPISENPVLAAGIASLDDVETVNKFIVKPGILKSDDYLQGVVFKGIADDFDWRHFKQYIIAGDTLAIDTAVKSDNILISKVLADILNLHVGDKTAAYFIQNPPRMRKFTVVGIYETQLEELDKLFVFADLRHLQKLNDWQAGQITGYEIHLSDFSRLDACRLQVDKLVGTSFSDDYSLLRVESIVEKYPGIFNWLALLDINVIVILVLMICVAGFNMISGLLVIILERVNMIGVLKSLGSPNVQVERIFVYVSSFLIGRGLLIGNVLGLGLCWLQSCFGIVTLDPASYYISTVPINFDVVHILLLNVGTMVVTVLMMVLPAMIISKIYPAESMKFE